MTGFILDVLSSTLLFVGGAFCLLAAVGILVMPDVYTRMQAASKAVTLGASAILLAVVLEMPDMDIVVRGLLVCVFLVVTVPAATHMLARAAYRSREPLASETTIDELANRGGIKVESRSGQRTHYQDGSITHKHSRATGAPEP